MKRPESTKVVAAAALALVGLLTLTAGAVAPHDPGEQFRNFLLAPPMPIRAIDAGGRLRAPFVYPLRLVDRVERRYEEDRSRRITLTWLSQGKFVRAGQPSQPMFLLGTDSLGRDVLSRLAIGARSSLGVALIAVLCAVLVGTAIGGLASFRGGLLDEVLMRFAEFVLVLPAIYVMLALRTVLPLVLPPTTVFVLMAGLLALAGWPFVARAVRATVAVERQREYAVAARALGASPACVLLRHVLPAARGIVLVQAIVLLPAFIVAETTLSFVGFGFGEPIPSWGAMLQDASNVRTMTQAPWLLAPACAVVLVVFLLTLLAREQSGGDILALDLRTRPRVQP